MSKIQKWEYLTRWLDECKYSKGVLTRSFDEVLFEKEINRWGEEGWEMVSISKINAWPQTVIVFKRPV